jgi:transcriptional regulator with XRE-family HTH domain
MMRLIGQKLIFLRKQRGWTQEDVAKKLGIHRGTYANYEIGKRDPDYETLSKLADMFDVTVDYLLDRSSKKIDVMELERRLREGEITYQGKPLSEEQCEILADFLLMILKREKKMDPKKVAS